MKKTLLFLLSTFLMAGCTPVNNNTNNGQETSGQQTHTDESGTVDVSKAKEVFKNLSNVHFHEGTAENHSAGGLEFYLFIAQTLGVRSDIASGILISAKNLYALQKQTKEKQMLSLDDAGTTREKAARLKVNHNLAMEALEVASPEDTASPEEVASPEKDGE